MKILILGCGNVGSDAATQLMERHGNDLDLVLGDYNLEAAQGLAQRLGANARALRVDVTDPVSLRAAMKDRGLVFNFVGPFYRTALPVIEAALEARIDYMDINDDYDVAFKLISDPTYHQRALAAGTRIVIGCGTTPGVTNVLARWGVNRMDTARAIRMCWVCSFVPHVFSPAVWDHVFHMFQGKVTQFLDGRYQQVPAYTGQRQVTFIPPFGTYPVSFSGHGEAVTIPHFIKGLEEASIRSFFFPQAGEERMQELLKLGFDSRESIPALGVSPLQFLGHYAGTEAGKRHLNVPLPPDYFEGSANQVEVEGTRGTDQVKLIIETHSLQIGQDPTAVCARVAIQHWIRGALQGQGLLAAEAAFDPEPYLREVVRDASLVLHEREEVIRSNSFRQ